MENIFFVLYISEASSLQSYGVYSVRLVAHNNVPLQGIQADHNELTSRSLNGGILACMSKMAYSNNFLTCFISLLVITRNKS